MIRTFFWAQWRGQGCPPMSWFDDIKEWTAKMVTEAVRVASSGRWKGSGKLSDTKSSN